jgi:hypothetical protein
MFTTLGGEFPTVPTTTETLHGGTLFRATGRGGAEDGRADDARPIDRRDARDDAGRRRGERA